MIVYCVTASNPKRLIYMGTSLKKAENAVGGYINRDHPLPKNFPTEFTILPKEMPWEMIQFYAHDGYWFSIVMFELEEEEDHA